jgi:hypothetical protein
MMRHLGARFGAVGTLRGLARNPRSLGQNRSFRLSLGPVLSRLACGDSFREVRLDPDLGCARRAAPFERVFPICGLHLPFFYVVGWLIV